MTAREELAEVIAAHTADWTDWVTSETDHEHYRCLCGLVEWHVNTSADYHQGHAEHVADVLAKAGYGKLADAFPIIRDLADPDDCWFDHHGGCQAHGYLSLKPGETCPQHDAKEWLKANEGIES